MKNKLVNFTAALARTGQRRLLALEGDNDWTRDRLAWLRASLPGDWLFVGARPEQEPHCSPGAVATLLGREFTHAILDVREGFDAVALAALAGTLKAGSWLVLLTPAWDSWTEKPDSDSVRWSDTTCPVATPHFVRHFISQFRQDGETLRWSQHLPFPDLILLDAPDWAPAHGAPEQEQQRVLATLMNIERGVAVLTAPRGRGKSALAGMLARAWPGRVLVTAPARAATDILAQHAGENFRFAAPDALTECVTGGRANEYDWLIIDEAAAIPGPVLNRLTGSFPRILMTTTVQGYEGTGRGFMLKFCAAIPHLQTFSLDRPIRWAQGDPLERFINALLLFDDDDFSRPPRGDYQITALQQSAWRKDPAEPGALYRLLAGAHYRTSPLDLRRMMDAPGQHFALARTGSQLAGALWLVEEGGLDAGLSRAVWAGFRRPRGNLVAQSLAAHGGSPLAATLRGLRVSRVAVHPARQRERIGSALIRWSQRYAGERADYLSVSFGFTPDLWRFWLRCGFTLVRIGSYREASSGCYTAMALLPLTEDGRALTQREHRRLCRDALWLQPWIDETLPVPVLRQMGLNDDDWLELAGFAFAHRPPEACTGSLNRLTAACQAPLPALRGRFSQRQSSAELCAALKINGRKALLIRMRQEAAQGLEMLDAARTENLAQQVRALAFS